MIDMVFLLLVFFMTVSTLAQDERIPLELPESEQANIPEEHVGRGTISLTWAEDGTVELYVGAYPASLEEMQSRIRESLRSNPDLEINVRATADMPFSEIRKVLRACAEAGAHKVIYATTSVQNRF